MSTDLRRSLKRGVAGVTAGMLVASGAIALAAPASAQTAPGDFDFTRLAGADRYGTAAAIARDLFNDDADTVVLASGQEFPDALSGNFLAGSLNAPILLTAPGFIPEVTSTTLDELGTSNITILGGTDAVSARVETELRADGFNVSRIGGLDRFKTAAQVAAAGTTVGEIDGQRTAVLANGLNFADALTAGPLAVDALLPVLLTTPTTLRPEARAALDAEDIEQVLIVGGTDAVSAAQEAQLTADGFAVERLAGVNRAETAVEIAEFAKANLGFSDDHVNLARGDKFPDALTGGPHGGAEMAPILLTGDVNNSAPATLAFLRENCETLVNGHIFGGLAAVSERVEMENEEAATCDAVAPSVVTVDGDNNTVVAGEDFTGTIRTEDGQNITNVAVSGRCIDDNTNLDETDTAGGSDFGFSIPVNADAATGDCVLTFVVTLEGGEQVTVTETINVVAPQEQPATATNTIEVMPEDAATATATVNPDTSTVDDRTFLIDGLRTGETYRITLVTCEKVQGSGTDAQFLAEEDTNSSTGFAAVTGAPTTDIIRVNEQDQTDMSPLAGFQRGTTTFVASGTSATFTIDGDQAPECVVPVVYFNNDSANGQGGESPRLELEGPAGEFSSPVEDFNVGGETNFVAAEEEPVIPPADTTPATATVAVAMDAADQSDSDTLSITFDADVNTNEAVFVLRNADGQIDREFFVDQEQSDSRTVVLVVAAGDDVDFFAGGPEFTLQFLNVRDDASNQINGEVTVDQDGTVADDFAAPMFESASAGDGDIQTVVVFS